MNKQNEKYKTMLKRKNKEKKIYKDKNASLQLEKQILYKALINREHEIERLNNIINELEKYLIEEIEDYKKQIKYHKKNKDIMSGILDLVGEYEGEKVCFEDMLGKLQELKGSDKE